MPTSVRNLKSLFWILSLESQRTFVWSSSCVCSASIFLQRRRNRRELRGRDLMKLMTLMLQFKTSCSWGLILFDANASLCIIQWVHFTFGFFSLASVTNPFMVPVIEVAASVHMLLQRVQFRLFSAKKASTTLKVSFPVVLPCILLQNNMCSAMSSASRYLTKPTSCALPLTSVDSSYCNANEPVSFATTWSTMSVATTSTLRLTVSLDNGTALNLSAAVLFSMVSATIFAAGSSSSSTIVKGFSAFATSRDTA